jgi:hypothetical protein
MTDEDDFEDDDDEKVSPVEITLRRRCADGLRAGTAGQNGGNK